MTRAGGGRFRRGPARRRRRRRGRDEWREQSFLELMSQLFRDLDFSIGSEAGYRIPLGAMIVQFNLEHNELVRLDGTTQRRIGYSHVACQR